MRGDYKDNHSNDDAKNPEAGVDAAVEGSGVWISFRRHSRRELKGYKVTSLKRFRVLLSVVL